MQVFAARRLDYAVGTRHQRHDAEDGRFSVKLDQIPCGQFDRTAGQVFFRRLADQPAHPFDRGQQNRFILAVTRRRQHVSFTHRMDRTIGGIQYIDPIMPIVGIHPDADVIDHPVHVAGLGIDDGIVPDCDAFLLAIHRRHPVPHAVGEKDFLPLEGDAIRLHSGVKAKADDHGKRENGKHHHRQRDLER